jgi:tripartite-type tricarboxylate transporter receptor subunit TctC
MKRLILGTALVVAAGHAAVSAGAEEFPSRPLRIVVGFTPGTTTDITARLLADKLSGELGQSVIVENRPGANSGLANQLVATATPDGHTMLIGTLSLVTAPMLYKSVPFDPKALTPVSLVVTAANVICVYPGLPVQSLPALISMAKAQPGKLRYGSSGRGSSAFLTLELLKSMAGINLQEIPYKATSQAVADTMAGQIEIYPPNIVSAFPMLKSGRLRALAVTSLKRSAALPDVPAVSEVVKGYDATTGIYGILVPRGTPKAILARLNRAIVAVTQMPDFRERMAKGGGEVVGSSAEEYAAYLAEQRRKWGTLFRQLGIKPD